MNQFDHLRGLLEQEFGGWLSADKLDAATKNLLDAGVIAPPISPGEKFYVIGKFGDYDCIAEIRNDNGVVFHAGGQAGYSSYEAAEQALKERETNG